MCPHTCSKSVDSFKKSNYVYACWGVTGPGPLLGHFSSRMVTFLISWSELIGFCDVWSVHIWFVYALLSMACLSGWVRVKTSLKHSVGKLSHALLMLCFVYVLRNLPYALDAAFWIFSRELFACSWCYALNILYCCDTLLMLCIQYFIRNLPYAVIATLWILSMELVKHF